MTELRGARRAGARATAACLALLAVVFVLLARWSFGKWADVQTDWGSELYVPWQIVEGRWLYRDLAYKNGPLSPYVCALLFRVFGASSATLWYANLALLAGVCVLCWRFLARSTDRLAATAACLVFLCVFAFSQYTRNGGFDWAAPYQHSQTHGLAAVLGMLALLGSALERPARARLGAAGVLLGLVFLTKAELFAPAAAVCAGAFVLLAARHGRAVLLAPLGTTLAGALAPPLVALLLLARGMPLPTALDGVLGNWAFAASGAAADPFYAAGAGLDDVRGNLLRSVLAFAVLAGGVWLAVLAEARLPAGRGRRITAAALGLLAAAALGLAPAELDPWTPLARALPWTSLALGLALGALYLRDPRGARAPRYGALALFALLATLLLGKMLLNARVHHYGFVLALPATLLLVSACVRLLPELAGGGELLRALALAGVAAGAVFHLRWSDRYYAVKDFPVGRGQDRVLALRPEYDPRGAAFAQALGELEGLLERDATLAVLPEGASLGFWLRRPSPARFHLFLPPELAAFGGEAVLLADLAAHPPDWVALVDRDHAEFGVGPFGTDPRNGRAIVEWVRAEYRSVSRIESAGFGIELLRRAPR